MIRILSMSDKERKRFLKLNPEYASILEFASWLLDNERNTFTGAELQTLSTCLRQQSRVVRRAIEAYGINLEQALAPHKPRGTNSSDSDRWYGPGSDS